MFRTIRSTYMIGFLICLMVWSNQSQAGQLKVIHVYDGDTIKVIRKKRDTIVRLIGIDAPETYKRDKMPGQPFSRKSQKLLSRLVLGKVVRIRSYGTDDYKRVLGVVYVGKLNVNLEMIRSGLAETYRGIPSKGFDNTAYKEAETEARRARRGMWVQGKRYISPYEWRRMHRSSFKTPSKAQ